MKKWMKVDCTDLKVQPESGYVPKSARRLCKAVVDIKIVTSLLQFFAFNTKLQEMAMMSSNDFIAAKRLPPVGPDLMITIW